VRYLEQGNVTLVKEALKEREYILTKADHISRVQKFIVPCYSRLKMLYYYTGLKSYDILAGKKNIGKTSMLKKAEVIAKIPNIKTQGLVGGVQYMDGQFDDTRLCIDLVKTIIKHGGTCINHAGVINLLKKEGKVCGAKIKDEISGSEFEVRAKYVVNAAGIFTDDIVQMDDEGSRRTIIPSRGSHIVLDKSFLGDDTAIMIPKTSDGRVLFVIPWNGNVVVGTTDEKTKDPSAEPEATEKEISFILENCHKYLTKKPERSDILTTFAGLRPLAAPKEGSQKTKEISRGHKIIISESNMISIIGGKWTTFRKMGEDVIAKISTKLNGNFQSSNSKGLQVEGHKIYSSEGRLHPDLPYSEDDFDYVIQYEMSMTLEDVLCRRTRCLFLNSSATSEIIDIIGNKLKNHLGETDEWLQNQSSEINKLIRQYAV